MHHTTTHLVELFGEFDLKLRVFQTATHCNTLQHTAAGCNTLHQAATHLVVLFGKFEFKLYVFQVALGLLLDGGELVK